MINLMHGDCLELMIACKNLNRGFIGIEKDDNYFNIAKNRIENCNS